MRAVLPFDPTRGPEPVVGELPAPVAGPGEVLLKVRATAINRADLLQLQGLYPPPPGEPAGPGLECAGTIEAVGEGVAGWRVGEAVMALLGGGGHAERVAAPSGQLLPLPPGWSFAEGAALPEAAITAWANLVGEGRLAPGQTVIVSGAAGGIGSFAVQLARELGATVVAAGRRRERLEPLRALGAAALCELGEDLPARVREATAGHGADLALDLVGGRHLPALLAALAPGGRLVLLGLLAGVRAEIDLSLILRRRLTVVGSTLRARSRAEKATLVAAFGEFAAGRLADGRLRAVVDHVVSWPRIAEAYAAAALGVAFGKIVVTFEGVEGC
jgi:putative PIG3 family NAD(P)H quinone oxidoreductase